MLPCLGEVSVGTSELPAHWLVLGGGQQVRMGCCFQRQRNSKQHSGFGEQHAAASCWGIKMRGEVARGELYSIFFYLKIINSNRMPLLIIDVTRTSV